MKIAITNNTPSVKEIMHALKNSFHQKSAYKFSMSEDDKTLKVYKSSIVGVKIKIQENCIVLEEIVPSKANSFVVSLFTSVLFVGLDTSIILFLEKFSLSPWLKMEKEISTCLMQNYKW
ncbi:MAG: hypothetical protein CMO01_19825 [Thalassobius sp.]|nr:hypothetical protein [Thalassovita sp.]